MTVIELADKLQKSMSDGIIAADSDVRFLPHYGAITEGNGIEDIMLCRIVNSGKECVYLCEAPVEWGE